MIQVSTLTLRTLAEIEREAIEAALVACNGNKSEAARRLGITARTIRNKQKEYAVLDRIQKEAHA